MGTIRIKWELADRIRLVRMAAIYICVLIGALLLIPTAFGYIGPLLLLVPVPLVLLLDYVIEKSSSVLGTCFAGWSSREVRPAETFEADLARARHSKSKGAHEEALNIVDEVLEKAPDSAEGLFLKAQIQWEGFGNAKEAARDLEKVMKIIPEGDTLHRWASKYYQEIDATKE